MGHAQLVVVLGGIPVQREGLKALVPQLQQGGQALDLFPGAQLPQAVAHLAAPPAPVAALGAQGGVVQAVRGKSALGEHLAAPLLEGLVLLPDLRHPGGGIGAVVKGGGSQRQHARPEPGVNLFYLGQGLVDLGAHPALLGLMGGPAAV